MDTKTIKAYLDADGCVTQMPSKKKKKLCVLAYLADRIPEDREYTEREFNEVLNQEIWLISRLVSGGISGREMFQVNRPADSVFSIAAS